MQIQTWEILSTPLAHSLTPSQTRSLSLRNSRTHERAQTQARSRTHEHERANELSRTPHERTLSSSNERTNERLTRRSPRTKDRTNSQEASRTNTLVTRVNERTQLTNSTHEDNLTLSGSRRQAAHSRRMLTKVVHSLTRHVCHRRSVTKGFSLFFVSLVLFLLFFCCSSSEPGIALHTGRRGLGADFFFFFFFFVFL